MWVEEKRFTETILSYFLKSLLCRVCARNHRYLDLASIALLLIVSTQLVLGELYPLHGEPICSICLVYEIPALRLFHLLISNTSPPSGRERSV
jgi:hypothetical protein